MTYAMKRRCFVSGLAAVLIGKHCAAEPAAFAIVLSRKYSSDKCTSGYLAVDGKIISYILELPWKDNVPLISAIPVGTYDGILRYDHPDKWRIELTNVPGRSNVQIHTGNTPDDSEGCILVGMEISNDLCSVSDSKKAYEALKNFFYGSTNPLLTPNKNIKIKVEV
jgi:hypothetical protein